MMNLTLTPNRSTQPPFMRGVKYEGSNFEGPPHRVPVRRLIETVDGKPKCTRVTELRYQNMDREAYHDKRVDWSESRDRTHYLESRTGMIIEGLIRTPGHGEPCLALTDEDWVKAERILAGLDSGELEPIVEETSDSVVPDNIKGA